MITLMILAASVAATSYDCEIESPAVVSITESGAASRQPFEGLPPEALRFSITLDGQHSAIDWPNSPIQTTGEQTILPTSDQSGMVLSVFEGPCLLTEQACATMLSYARQPDGTLRILIQPTAISRNQNTDIRVPFLVFARGECTPKVIP